MGIIQLCSSLQKSGMKVENVTRISLTAWRTADQKRKCTVSHRMFTQVIVDDEYIFSFVHKVFAHGAAGVRRNILQRAGLGSSSGYNGGVVHGAVFGEIFYKSSHSGTLLADGNVNTDDIFALLVDDRIRSNGGFTGLTVTDDQLTLTAADRDHGVDRFDPGLERFVNGAPFTDTGKMCIRDRSEDMEAGTYPLTIRLTYKGEVLTEKTVEVEVIGAVLPAMKVPHTEWFHSDCLADYYGVEVFSEEYWRIVENFVRTAGRHRYKDVYKRQPSQ